MRSTEQAKRVLVTGGAGFVGSNLVQTLVVDPGIEEVVVIDDLSTGDRRNLDGVAVELHELSVLDEDAVVDVAGGVDAIVHLAAVPSVPRSVADPVASHAANATGTVHLLQAARRIGNPHVVLASSSSVYGANPTLPKREDMTPQPMSPYAASKLAAEAYARSYAEVFGLDVLTFRFFNVFGPAQPASHAYAAVVPRFVAAALAGTPLEIFGDGEQTRDFTFVGSVVSVLADAIGRRVTSPDPVNLAFGTNRRVLDVVDCLSEILEQPLDVVHRPPRAGDVRHSQADARRLGELFPDLSPILFEDGLRATLEWFRSTSAEVPRG